MIKVNKILFAICISTLLSPIAFAVIEEGHNECDKYNSKIAQLNTENYSLYEYSVYPSWSYPGWSYPDSHTKSELPMDSGNAIIEVIPIEPLIENDNSEDIAKDDQRIPTCVFSKKTLGGVELKTEISKTTSFIDINTKFENFESSFSKIITENEKHCSFSRSSYFLSSRQNPSGTYDLFQFGDVYCTSTEDLGFLENIDIENLLEISVKNTDIEFEVLYQPSPVISGTTIHN